jgi:sugar-phosphatase
MRLDAGTVLRAKAILFDMDGTLIDSTAVAEAVWRRWAARYGLDADEIIRTSHGRRTIDTARRFCPPGADPAAEAAWLESEERHLTDGLRPVPGASPLLQSLPRDRWAVVTSADRALAVARFAATGLPLPDVLITADGVQRGKPDPEGYLAAARRLGVSAPETIVFEDAPAGLAAGHASGARVIALATILGPDDLRDEDFISDFQGVRFEALEDDLLVISVTPRRT